MLARSSRRQATPAAFIAGGVLALATLTGCSSGPLDTKCSEFVEMSETEQADVVKAWNKDKGMDGPMAEMSADSDRASMQDYCSDDSHADDKIGDLVQTFG